RSLSAVARSRPEVRCDHGAYDLFQRAQERQAVENFRVGIFPRRLGGEPAHSWRTGLSRTKPRVRRLALHSGTQSLFRSARRRHPHPAGPLQSIAARACRSCDSCSLKSAFRSRCSSTTAAGARSTKEAFESFALTVRNSFSNRAISLSRRSRSA